MRAKLVILFFTITFFVFGQNKVLDSLLLQVNKTTNASAKASLLNSIADEYKNSNPKVMLEYAIKAKDLATKIGNKLEVANAYQNIGTAHLAQGSYALALDNFSQAQVIFENLLKLQTNNKNSILQNGLARAYGSIGFVFMQQSNYAKALDYNFKALKLFEMTNNQEKLARIYNNFGVIYKSMEDFPKALVYYDKCLQIQKKNPNELLGVYYNNIGLIYLELKNNTKALEYFLQSKSCLDKYPNMQGLAQLYYNLAIYYNENKQFEKATESTKKALFLFTSLENKFGLADSYAKLAEINILQRNSDEAIINLNKSLDISRSLKSFDKIKAFEETLSNIYEQQNNPAEALKHFKLYSIAKDSVTNAETIKNAIKTEMNFEFDKKQMLQTEVQEKRELLYQEKQKSYNLKVIFTLLFAIFAAAAVFVLYNNKQTKKRLILEKELAIYEQKALHLQMNPHFIFNCLGSISSFIVKNSTDAAIKYLAKFSKLMRLTLEYSKEALIPIDKEIESLQNYLELEQLRFNHSFQFSITKCNEIDDDVALPPLLLQPFVENAIIHGMNPKAKDGKINVSFTLQDDSLVCVVSDNGIGINQSKAQKENFVSMHKSMALNITNKRLQMMQTATAQVAKVKIIQLEENGIVMGTQATLVLPLQYISIFDLNNAS